MSYLDCIQGWLCLPVSGVKTWFQIERIGSTTPKNRKVKETYFVSQGYSCNLFFPILSLSFSKLIQHYRKERKACHGLHCTVHQGFCRSDVNSFWHYIHPQFPSGWYLLGKIRRNSHKAQTQKGVQRCWKIRAFYRVVFNTWVYLLRKSERLKVLVVPKRWITVVLREQRGPDAPVFLLSSDSKWK